MCFIANSPSFPENCFSMKCLSIMSYKHVDQYISFFSSLVLGQHVNTNANLIFTGSKIQNSRKEGSLQTSNGLGKCLNDEKGKQGFPKEDYVYSTNFKPTNQFRKQFLSYIPHSNDKSSYQYGQAFDSSKQHELTSCNGLNRVLASRVP